MSLRIFTLLLFVSVAFIACSDDDSPTDPVTPSDVLLPMSSGNYWIMERTHREQGSVEYVNDTTRVLDVAEIAGNTWYSIGTVEEGSEWFMRNTAAGVAVYEKNQESLFLPFPAQMGDSTHVNSSEGIYTVFVVATDKEVETPAGTFTCYKYYWEQYPGAEFEAYFAPHMGFVKIIFEFEYTSPEYPDGYHVKDESVLLEYHVD